jgi:hypothetical protein
MLKLHLFYGNKTSEEITDLNIEYEGGQIGKIIK